MRRNLDQYFTPASAVETLLTYVPLHGRILECCSGDHAIASVLRRRGVVFTNDLDRTLSADFHEDVSIAVNWRAFNRIEQPNWVVTNPPFNKASLIVPLAYKHANVGIAMLLRLSYLEPVENRGSWLNEHPPTKLIVLPRISFTGNGKTDNVTCAWMVWEKSTFANSQIVVAKNPRFSKE